MTRVYEYGLLACLYDRGSSKAFSVNCWSYCVDLTEILKRNIKEKYTTHFGEVRCSNVMTVLFSLFVLNINASFYTQFKQNLKAWDIELDFRFKTSH